MLTSMLRPWYFQKSNAPSTTRTAAGVGSQKCRNLGRSKQVPENVASVACVKDPFKCTRTFHTFLSRKRSEDFTIDAQSPPTGSRHKLDYPGRPSLDALQTAMSVDRKDRRLALCLQAPRPNGRGGGFDRPSTDAERALSEHSLLPAPLAPLLLEGVAHSQLTQLAALRIVHGHTPSEVGTPALTTTVVPIFWHASHPPE